MYASSFCMISYFFFCPQGSICCILSIIFFKICENCLLEVVFIYYHIHTSVCYVTRTWVWECCGHGYVSAKWRVRHGCIWAKMKSPNNIGYLSACYCFCLRAGGREFSNVSEIPLLSWLIIIFHQQRANSGYIWDVKLRVDMIQVFFFKTKRKE